MRLPVRVQRGVRQALEERGLGVRIEGAAAVGGGCINNGARIETDAGVTLFLKWNLTSPDGMFGAEADGLSALRAVGALGVPVPVAWHDGADGAGWLLLEYVAPGRATAETYVRLGRGLATVHASSAPGRFGWSRDNWIGSLPQANRPTLSWPEFWRAQRIVPQLKMARLKGYAMDDIFDRVMDVIPTALADVGRPDLLHGDLWGGNWFPNGAGEPVLIDPAVYRGHGEVDLAMSELFGGFTSAFYDAYAEARAISHAYTRYRRDLYQLYYLLAHVNLFGASYEAGSLRAARRVVAELAA